MFEFLHPGWFWALLVIPLWLSWELLFKRKRQPRLVFTRITQLKQAGAGGSIWPWVFLALRLIAICAIIVALARPRYAYKRQEVSGKGVDIVLAIDLSGSMQAIDEKPDNRLTGAKRVAKHFIDQRVNDRVGIVTFADHAFTACPLTPDYNILKQVLDNLEIDKESQGTAIGMGLATSVARLKDSTAKNKTIILITDGRNNRGEIDPPSAAELAAIQGIKVYTIGVGKKGQALMPYQHPLFGLQYRPVEADIDMETLDMIAAKTGTERARRAQNTQELQKIIDYIDKLEKTEYKIHNFFQYKEIFFWFIWLAALAAGLEVLTKIALVRPLP